MPEDLPLGGRDPVISGPDNLVHWRNAFGAECERAYGLRPADPVNFLDACKPRGGKHQRVERARRRRHRHREPPDACHPGGNCIHQHRTRIGGGASRHIQADRLDRRPAQTEPHAEPIAVIEIGRQLRPVERLDPRCRQFERIPGRRRRFGKRPVQRFDRNTQRTGHAVETPGVVRNGCIAARPDIGEDRSDRGIDIFRPGPVHLHQRVEISGEIRIGRVKPPGQGRPPGSARSSPEAPPCAS